MFDFTEALSQLVRFVLTCAALSVVLACLLMIIMNPIAAPTSQRLASSKAAAKPVAATKLPPYSSEEIAAPAKISINGSYKKAGNSYARGHCTWYAKSKRPDLPNNLGNANTWYSRAKSQGLPTGLTPKPGAIGQKGMHVVYVEQVNPNGTMRISEMNYRGLGVVSHRTVPAGTFKFIY